MGRLRGWAWGIALVALALYLGRLWFSDLRVQAVTLARGVAGLVGGTGGGIEPPLHAPPEAAVTLALIAAWVVLALVAPRAGPFQMVTLGGRLPLAAAMLAITGLAGVVVLAMATAAPGFAGPPLVVAASLVAVLFTLVTAWAARGRRPAASRSLGRDPDAADPRASPPEPFSGPSDPDATREVAAPTAAGTRLAGLLRPAVGVISLAALLLLAGAVLRDGVYLAFYRPPATGDEANFWWRATDALHQLGWGQYLTMVDSAGYVPGYPLAANVLLGWVPASSWTAAGRALPFLYGFLALALLVRPAARRGPLCGPSGPLGPTAGFIYVVGYVLLMPGVQGDWIHEMFFRLWYGEAFATVLTVLILALVDQARHASWDGQAARRTVAALAVAGFGLGAIAVISKPPLSFLLVPAVLPVLVLGGWLLRARGATVRPLLLTAAALATGALLTNALWGAQLRVHEVGSYYALDVRSLLTFHPDGSFWPLVRYFVVDYQPTWVAFIVVGGLALVRDPRRFAPALLVAAGMAASIFVLYLGAWSDVEHESGARYILHGLDGFTLFALAALTPAIRSTFERWLSRIERRLAGRSASTTPARPGLQA